MHVGGLCWRAGHNQKLSLQLAAIHALAREGEAILQVTLVSAGAWARASNPATASAQAQLLPRQNPRGESLNSLEATASLAPISYPMTMSRPGFGCWNYQPDVFYHVIGN